MTRFPGNTFCTRTEAMSIAFHNKDESRKGWKEQRRYEHFGTFHRVMNYLAEIGYQVGRDPEVEKDYPCISRDFRYGRRGDLEFKAHVYPSGFEIQYFQNINYVNQNGGCYDFDKYAQAPYLSKKQILLDARKISVFLLRLGYTRVDEFIAKTAEDFVKHDYMESWHHPQKDMDFDLRDLDGQTFEKYNSTDRDEKIIHNGEIKYYRNDFNGRIFRGRVYHNINNMWWVILSRTKYTNIASFHLFDLSDADDRGRVKRKVLPKAYAERRKGITEATTSELMR